jgi:hypothetical protein
MKRLLIFSLISPFFISATPEYKIKTNLVKNFSGNAETHRLQPNQNFIHNITSETHDYQYTLNMKLISVVNTKAHIEYLMNRQQPNPTSHTDFKQVEVNTELYQQIPCLADDNAVLWVRIESTPTDSSSCITL